MVPRQISDTFSPVRPMRCVFMTAIIVAGAARCNRWARLTTLTGAFPHPRVGRRKRMTPADSQKVLADVEAFCQEIRPVEELCYVEHRFNDQVIPLARKHNILSIPVPVEYGGRGADTVTYARALARIGREGTGVRTFFSGHVSIGQYPIMTWGNEEHKRPH